MTCFQGDMCDKTPGLPIVPVRYAVAKKEAVAPELPNGFEVSEPIDLGKDTHYALRLLRSGYLYVYNPNDDLEPWRGYIVTPQGYFCPFSEPIDKDGPKKLDHEKAVKEPCKPTENGTIAQCITIPNAEKAEKNIRIAFSEVEWTHGVWERFNESCKKNKGDCLNVMREFNVKDWLASGKAIHAGRVADMDQKIVEFTAGVKAKEFSFSSDPLVERNWGSPINWDAIAKAVGMRPPVETKKIMEEMLKLPPEKQKALFIENRFSSWGQLAYKLNRLNAATKNKALVLALDDAPGIIGDLAALMIDRKNAFNKRFYDIEENYRRHVTSGLIVGLREQMSEQAAKDKEKAIYSPPLSAPGSITMPLAAFMKEEEIEREIHRAYENAWKDYEGFYDEKKIGAFHKKYTDKLKDFSDAEIVDLAKAHVAWMKSADMKDTMQFHFDENNPYSGIVYAGVISRSIGSSQEVEECQELYNKWMDGTATDKDNFYLRALLGNQKDDIELVEKFAAQAGGDKSNEEQQSIWNTLYRQYKMVPKVFKELTNDAVGQRNSIVSRLVAQGASAFLTKLAEASEGKYAKTGKLPFWLSLAAFLGKKPIPFVEISFSGSRKSLVVMGAILEDFTEAVASGNNKNIPANAKVKNNYTFNRRKHEMPEIKGGKQSLMDAKYSSGNRRLTVLLPIDMGTYSDGMKGIDYEKGKKRIVKSQYGVFKDSLKNARYIGAVEKGMADSFKDNTFAPIYSVYGIFLFAAFCAVNDDYRKNKEKHPELKDEFVSDVIFTRYINWGIASFSAFFEMTADVVERYENRIVRFTQSASLNNFCKKWVKGAGKLLGAGAAIVAAAIDWAHFVKAWSDGKKGLRLAYGFSTAISTATAVVISYMNITWMAGTQATTILGFSCAGILFALFIVAVVVYIWVDSEMKKDGLQTWLSRSCFGDGKRGTEYSDLKVEIAALEGVFK